LASVGGVTQVLSGGYDRLESVLTAPASVDFYIGQLTQMSDSSDSDASTRKVERVAAQQIVALLTTSNASVVARYTQPDVLDQLFQPLSNSISPFLLAVICKVRGIVLVFCFCV
jgi:AmiR/NasT family two-component response regulator